MSRRPALPTLAFRSRERQPLDDRFRRDGERIAQREQRDQRRLALAALQQRHERLIEAAIESKLRLRKPAFFPKFLEQPAERGAEPIGVFHDRQHGDCVRRLQRL